MAWATPQYSRTAVDAAGKILALGAEVDAPERDRALAIISNWRTSHAFPLQVVKMLLLNRARKVDPDRALVAQRLKRLTSIEAKLQRFEQMQLSQMHDIGGCRAVVRTAVRARRLVALYKAAMAKHPNPGDRPAFHREYDYVASPKRDGYRSVHLVYKYRTASPERCCYKDLRIEIQIRSRLQHAWATAVETVDTFTRQALKSSIGQPLWKEFFALMGSAIAIREKSPLVPGTPILQSILRDQLRALERRLNVNDWLEGLSVATSYAGEQEFRKANTVLLVLDADKRTMNASGFGKAELETATEQYLAAEKTIAENPSRQAVLVSVDRITHLQNAFPNYYADTTVFLEALRQAISGEDSDH